MTAVVLRKCRRKLSVRMCFFFFNLSASTENEAASKQLYFCLAGLHSCVAAAWKINYKTTENSYCMPTHH